MKIIFTGGGTGGHFYPIISIAQAINKLSKDNKFIKPSLYYFSPTPYNSGILYDNNIVYKKTSAGKIRRYFSIMNFFDLFKIGWGVLNAIIDVFDIYPDVVFGKGGFGSFPTLLAARLLRIPVIIHESDSVPGRVNLWAGKFAYRIALSYPEAAVYFNKYKKITGRIAVTGQPIQRELIIPAGEGAHRYWELNENTPTVLILGGSQGAEKINNAVMDALPELLKDFQVIHQVGDRNIKIIEQTRNAILLNNPLGVRYKVRPYLSLLDERMAAGAADIVISRAGSTIFEIAAWGKPSIIIPIDESVSHDQANNAFAFASTGAASVIKEANLTQNILISEIKRILYTPEIKDKMTNAAKNFFKPDADEAIAKEILAIALSHEELD